MSSDPEEDFEMVWRDRVPFRVRLWAWLRRRRGQDVASVGRKRVGL